MGYWLDRCLFNIGCLEKNAFDQVGSGSSSSIGQINQSSSTPGMSTQDSFVSRHPNVTAVGAAAGVIGAHKLLKHLAQKRMLAKEDELYNQVINGFTRKTASEYKSESNLDISKHPYALASIVLGTSMLPALLFGRGSPNRLSVDRIRQISDLQSLTRKGHKFPQVLAKIRSGIKFEKARKEVAKNIL
jgi:hypothetical protein